MSLQGRLLRCGFMTVLAHQGRSSCAAIAGHGDRAVREARHRLLLRPAAAVLLAAFRMGRPTDDLQGERPCECMHACMHARPSACHPCNVQPSKRPSPENQNCS